MACETIMTRTNKHRKRKGEKISNKVVNDGGNKRDPQGLLTLF